MTDDKETMRRSLYLDAERTSKWKEMEENEFGGLRKPNELFGEVVDTLYEDYLTDTSMASVSRWVRAAARLRRGQEETLKWVTDAGKEAGLDAAAEWATEEDFRRAGEFYSRNGVEARDYLPELGDQLTEMAHEPGWDPEEHLDAWACAFLDGLMAGYEQIQKVQQLM